jgi:hypothetical protein
VLGERLFVASVIEIPVRIIGDFQAEMDRQRVHTNAAFYAAPVYRSAPYRQRSLRRS